MTPYSTDITNRMDISEADTLTPSFPMEPPRKKKEVLPPKKAKVPQEGSSGVMNPPQPYLNENRIIYWRPNNYRRQIQVKPKNERIITFIKGWVKGNPPTLFKWQDQTKQIILTNFMGITIIYSKKTVVGIWKQNIIGGHKEIYKLSGTVQENDQAIKIKKEKLKERIDKAITFFIRKCSIEIPLKKPVWSRHEDFIKGESFIDSIPEEVIIHDSNFKKVYPNGIEFIGEKKGDEPTGQMRTYLKNRAIEDFAPEIAESIRKITAEIGTQQDLDKLKKVSLALIDAFTSYIESIRDEE